MDFLSLSHNEKQVLLGGLLGDSYFNKSRKIIRYYHSTKQLEYLKWKQHFFINNPAQFCSKIYTGRHKWNNQEYDYCSFEISNKNQCLNDFLTYLYKFYFSNDGRKKISLKYLYELDALGLAIWWMDDGNLSIYKGNRWGKFCTEYFNYEEHILLQKYFKEKWGILTDIKLEKGKYYFLRLNVSALRQLSKIIYKYVCEIPSMIYKIDMKYTNKKCITDLQEVCDYIEKIKSSQISTL